MNVNIVETADIHQFFLRQAEDDEELAGWLDTALTPSLLRREQNAVPLRRLPPDAPEWLLKKWPDGGPFHCFHADDELVNKIGHIVDWLEAARREDAPFLKKRDRSGVPLKMRNLNLEAAFNAANKYFERFNRSTPVPLDPFGNVKTVMEFRNGWRMVQLMTAAALATEGKNMNNCLGTYIGHFRDGWLLYSLRDRDGAPHVTLSLRDNFSVDQCRGRGGKPPAEKYLPDIVAFLNSKNATIPGHYRDLPGYFQPPGGPVVPRTALPEDAAPDSFILRQSPAVRAPCRPLFVSGGAYIESCPNLEEITEGLVVTGSLEIKDCFALRKFPRELPVGGDLTIDGCGLEYLYINFQMDGDIYLRNCWKLRYLDFYHAAWKNLYISDCEKLDMPDNIRVSKWLVFDKMKRQAHVPGGFSLLHGSFAVQHSDRVTSIGDNIFVKGNACFKNCPNLASLPRGLHIEGDLYINNCGITELPTDLRVDGSVKVVDCPGLTRICARLQGGVELELENCPRLAALAPLAGLPKSVRIFRCPALGPVLPPHLRGCPAINTDLFLSEEAALL